MPLTRDDVRHIAGLARIALDETEIERLQGQLSQILDHFQALSEADTTGVPPTAQILEMQNVMRDDVSRPSLPRDETLANAPDREEAFLRVRAVLE